MVGVTPENLKTTSQEKEPALGHAWHPEHANARLTLPQSSKVLSICFHPFYLEGPREDRYSIMGGRGGQELRGMQKIHIYPLLSPASFPLPSYPQMLIPRAL